MKKTINSVRFQEVTLRLPKSIIDYVDRMYGHPRQWLEYYIVDWIRIDVEMKTEQELKNIFNLERAFKEILG